MRKSERGSGRRRGREKEAVLGRGEGNGGRFEKIELAKAC